MKKLEDLFELPESKEFLKEVETKKQVPKIKENTDPFIRDISDLDKISLSLPTVTGLGNAADKELDELALRATSAYDDLMELGMQVEPRFAGRIFEVAGNMLQHAIAAKTAKIDKKIKILDLQIKKAKLPNQTVSAELKGDGYIVSDRNSLLEKIKNIN